MMPASRYGIPFSSGGVVWDMCASLRRELVSIVTPQPVLAPLNTAIGFLEDQSLLKLIL